MPELTHDEMITIYQETVAKLSEGNALADVLSDMLDCSYYEKGEISKWNIAPCDSSTPMQWIRFEKLPTGESEDYSYRPKERMQGLLNTLRGINDKTAFALIKEEGYIHLYMGVFSQNLGVEAVSQLRSLVELNLTGATVSLVENLPNRGNISEVESALNSMNSCGILTGQPSIRRDMNENPLQTLDKLTAIFRNDMDLKKTYAVLILAEPVADGEVKDIINRVLHLKSDLQEYRKYTSGMALAQTSGQTRTNGFGVGGGMAEIGALGEKLLDSGIKGLASLGLTAAVMSTGIGAATSIHDTAEKILTNIIGLGIHGFHSKASSQQMTQNKTVSVERVNHSVEYCMGLLDKLIARLQGGRNQGFWNVGTYILANNAADVGLVAATLRSIYAGKDTYQEPLRIFNFAKVNSKQSAINDIIKKYVNSMSLLPLPTDARMKDLANEISDGESWHILGKLYESLTTPLNTEELSIMMSLPHRDVAGLSIRKDAVEFSTNPPSSEDARTVDLGTILDMGTPTGHRFSLNIDRLNSHGLVVGKCGSGKPVTSRNHILRFFGFCPGLPRLFRAFRPDGGAFPGSPGFFPGFPRERRRFSGFRPGFRLFPGFSAPIPGSLGRGSLRLQSDTPWRPSQPPFRAYPGSRVAQPRLFRPPGRAGCACAPPALARGPGRPELSHFATRKWPGRPHFCASPRDSRPCSPQGGFQSSRLAVWRPPPPLA